MLKYKWLHISVFCYRENFSRIVNDCINPFLSDIEGTDLCNKFLIHLNEQKGENIRISFYIVEDQCMIFLDRVNLIFNNYFSGIPLKQPPSLPPLTNFIADFPPNSVFYNLHKNSFNHFTYPFNEIILSFQFGFSKTLCEAFRKEDFDDETIETFFIYSSFTLFVAVTKTGANLQKIILDVQGILDEELSGQDIEVLENLFKQLKSGIMEIGHDLFMAEYISEDMKWIIGWKECCTKYLFQMEGHEDPFPIQRSIFTGLNKIAEHLNLQPKRFQSLTWVIVKALREMNTCIYIELAK